MTTCTLAYYFNTDINSEGSIVCFNVTLIPGAICIYSISCNLLSIIYSKLACPIKYPFTWNVLCVTKAPCQYPAYCFALTVPQYTFISCTISIKFNCVYFLIENGDQVRCNSCFKDVASIKQTNCNCFWYKWQPIFPVNWEIMHDSSWFFFY